MPTQADGEELSLAATGSFSCWTLESGQGEQVAPFARLVSMLNFKWFAEVPGLGGHVAPIARLVFMWYTSQPQTTCLGAASSAAVPLEKPSSENVYAWMVTHSSAPRRMLLQVNTTLNALLAGYGDLRNGTSNLVNETNGLVDNEIDDIQIAGGELVNIVTQTPPDVNSPDCNNAPPPSKGETAPNCNGENFYCSKSAQGVCNCQASSTSLLFKCAPSFQCGVGLGAAPACVPV
ncbi:hypothetical protein KFL_008050030 [Klebsormidium nitens]|uniref:Uncharacterized protein n=1 Tax=Klebsormidium nitens TaxID=105231 RepID=A0A1Y1IQM6_KLENI|nr:hypothetical protein KFL_008050030 [Klebsormidium nitens]|eukprot:GAQ91551.1 hypothetical protein KFL_008050030 [Klebsormidium nitens]